ncbi:MAG TPA: S-methyl-5'-thioadenosine phosphorylase [Firmicutes bacterium]|jgi:5'-methylthioadenosine phosphorylase|nr:S-methyl-5'-thioadenosine phosphorylase [Bacillota bacterium]
MTNIKYGIIGGSGFYHPDLLKDVREIQLETPYGEIKPLIGWLDKLEVAFLPRHGQDHSVLPHQVNYRANIWGLHSLGVEKIIATTAVGSFKPELPPGSMMIADQFLDFTKNRVATFYEQGDVQKAHIDITEPYCPALRVFLGKAAAKINLPVQIGGCYVCAEGPRYETAAEIRMFRMLGGTVVGMTGIPEVVLARELGICYANLSTVTNWAAGISVEPLNHTEVVQIMSLNKDKLRRLIGNFLLEVNDELKCGCRR